MYCMVTVTIILLSLSLPSVLGHWRLEKSSLTYPREGQILQGFEQVTFPLS